MTLDEAHVENKLRKAVSDLVFNKITDVKAVQKDKNKLFAMVDQTDIQMLLDHDDCPKTNLTQLCKLSLEEIKKDDTNWSVVLRLLDEVRK